MSSQESLSNHSGTSAPNQSIESSTAPAKPSGSARTRSIILVVVLLLLIGALWYDYKVARPGVEAAFSAVEAKNAEINALPGQQYVTDKTVQQVLNRTPRSSFVEGPYHVEVYSWRAGLPIRSHNYYAVYSNGSPLVFLKHYKFELPMEELKIMPAGGMGMQPPPGMSITPAPSAPAATSTASGGDGPKMRTIRPRNLEPSDAGSSDAGSSDAGSSDAGSSDAGSADASPSAGEPAGDAPETNQPADASSPPEETDPPAEQPEGSSATETPAPDSDDK